MYKIKDKKQVKYHFRYSSNSKAEVTEVIFIVLSLPSFSNVYTIYHFYTSPSILNIFNILFSRFFQRYK